MFSQLFVKTALKYEQYVRYTRYVGVTRILISLINGDPQDTTWESVTLF